MTMKSDIVQSDVSVGWGDGDIRGIEDHRTDDTTAENALKSARHVGHGRSSYGILMANV